jgi:hypothetical protein
MVRKIGVRVAEDQVEKYPCAEGGEKVREEGLD